MVDFLNKSRPPVYCPGCTHDKITTGLNKSFQILNLAADQIVIVTDIGCSGLFDTFFNVHALHGTHGRALTYAAGIKLARPELNVIVTMGDGGLGIGGAHVLAACRRNLDLTLIVLNNFNFGMTGGQYSATTPADAITGSGFLNQAEIPIDICGVARSAGATYIDRCSGFDPELPQKLGSAIEHKGFSIVETLGMCTGRYTKKNRITPKSINEIINTLPKTTGPVKENMRQEYGQRYRELANEKKNLFRNTSIKKQVEMKNYSRQEVVILGSAGMRIVTAGELMCHAGICAGMHVSLKNDYNITVLRGQSVSEILISPQKIKYTGITSPSIIAALSDEGVARKKDMFKTLNTDTIILKEKNVSIPRTDAQVIEIDFKQMGIKKLDWALACLGIMSGNNMALNSQMLRCALNAKFSEPHRKTALEVIEKTAQFTL